MPDHHEFEPDYKVVQVGEGTEDLGVPSGWHKVNLHDVIDLRLSSVDKNTKHNERAVRLCNYTDVYKNSFIYGDMDFLPATATAREIAKCSLIEGDVVITKDSEQYDDIGVPALVREDIPDLVCGYHLAILRPCSSEIHGAYLFYALSTAEAQQQFHSYANGITRFGLRKADIGLVEIPHPPLSKQRDIAHILGTLDDKIELTRRMNETLEEMARALFKSWFVDFAPVRAKAALKQQALRGDEAEAVAAPASQESEWTVERARAYLAGMDPQIVDLFSDRLADSELGEIPEGWEVKGLDDIADFTNGLALQRFPPEGDKWLPVIKIAEMRRGYSDKTGRASAKLDPRYIVEDGDLLFSWSGSLELVFWAHGRGALNQHLFKVTSEQCPQWFYWGWISVHLDAFRANRGRKGHHDGSYPTAPSGGRKGSSPTASRSRCRRHT